MLATLAVCLHRRCMATFVATVWHLLESPPLLPFLPREVPSPAGYVSSFDLLCSSYCPPPKVIFMFGLLTWSCWGCCGCARVVCTRFAKWLHVKALASALIISPRIAAHVSFFQHVSSSSSLSPIASSKFASLSLISHASISSSLESSNPPLYGWPLVQCSFVVCPFDRTSHHHCSISILSAICVIIPPLVYTVTPSHVAATYWVVVGSFWASPLFANVWFLGCVVEVVLVLPLFVWPTLMLCCPSTVVVSSFALCEVLVGFASADDTPFWLVVGGLLKSLHFSKMFFLMFMRDFTCSNPSSSKVLFFPLSCWFTWNECGCRLTPLIGLLCCSLQSRTLCFQLCHARHLVGNLS